MRRAPIGVVLVGAMSLLTGCAYLGDNTVHPTLTRAQTTDRLNAYLHETANVFAPPVPVLRPVGGSAGPNETSCNDPDDGGPRGRLTLDLSYWLDGLPKDASAAALVDRFVSYWTSRGFGVLFDDRPAERTVSLQNARDGYRIMVQTADDGSVSLTVSSPCIWPDGIPPPGAG